MTRESSAAADPITGDRLLCRFILVRGKDEMLMYYIKVLNNVFN